MEHYLIDSNNNIILQEKHEPIFIEDDEDEVIDEEIGEYTE